MIETFNKQNLKQLRQDLNKVLSQFVETNSLGKMEIGNIRFNPNEFTVKLTTTTKLQNGKVNSLPIINVSDIKVGDRFREKRTEYTVTSTNNKGMFRFSVKTHTGKLYKIKPEHLSKMERIK